MIRYIPLLSMMALIFFLSQQPGNTFDLRLPENSDKIAHAAIYGLLAASCLFFFAHDGRRITPFHSVGIVLFCLFFGITDEWHQSFIPLRTPSFFDLAADVFGATIIVLAHRYLLRHHRDIG